MSEQKYKYGKKRRRRRDENDWIGWRRGVSWQCASQSMLEAGNPEPNPLQSRLRDVARIIIYDEPQRNSNSLLPLVKYNSLHIHGWIILVRFTWKLITVPVARGIVTRPALHFSIDHDKSNYIFKLRYTILSPFPNFYLLLLFHFASQHLCVILSFIHSSFTHPLTPPTFALPLFFFAKDKWIPSEKRRIQFAQVENCTSVSFSAKSKRAFVMPTSASLFFLNLMDFSY